MHLTPGQLPQGLSLGHPEPALALSGAWGLLDKWRHCQGGKSLCKVVPAPRRSQAPCCGLEAELLGVGFHFHRGGHLLSSPGPRGGGDTPWGPRSTRPHMWLWQCPGGKVVLTSHPTWPPCRAVSHQPALPGQASPKTPKLYLPPSRAGRAL